MQQTQQFDALTLDPVDHDERRAADNQLARVFLASWSTHPGMVDQHVHLLFNPVTVADRRQGVVQVDVIKLCVAIIDGPFEPDQDQAALPARLTSSARFFFQEDLASAADTHLTLGASASWIAMSTCARNHLS